MKKLMQAAPTEPGQLSSANGNRDGLCGFGAAVGFLLFVSKFNVWVQTQKAKRSKKQFQATQKSFSTTVWYILHNTCSWREFSTVAKLSLMLLLRTVGSIWVANHWGKIVNSVVTRSFRRMNVLITQFAGVCVSLSVLNSLLKYYIASLKLDIREKVTCWCHKVYMRPKDMIYYKANKVGKEKVENCDHQITSDVEKFSEIFADVLSQSLKPIVDFLVYSVELSRVQGLATPLTLYSWFALSSCISAWTLPPFGSLAAREQELEGKFRSTHSSLITNCEQIAFLGGERPEQLQLDKHFKRLIDHCRRSVDLAFNSEVVRQYLNKYFVTVIGLFLLGRPLRLGLHGMSSYTAEQIAQYFTSTWRNMEAMASAIQDLFELTNRVGRLSGFSTRIVTLMHGLQERPPVLQDEIEAAKRGPYPPRFHRGPHLRFEHVSIYKPDGMLLVRDLNFVVRRGDRVLVTGENGCGKSSLFRVTRRLWPLVEGTITMPSEEDIHFLTQVNFCPAGTLRDLVTYPKTKEEVEAEGRTDTDVMACLCWAHISPELGPDGRADLQFTQNGTLVRPALDDVRDWQKDLSPGQKQRLAFARLFYHKPAFVVLDECTNGISPEVEHDLYDRCTTLNLAVFSISHKIELKLFHDYELRYKGDMQGGWSLTKCSERKGNITTSSSRVNLHTLSEQSLGADGSSEEAWDEATLTLERHVSRSRSESTPLARYVVPEDPAETDTSER